MEAAQEAAVGISLDIDPSAMVTEPPKLDLEAYVANYAGKTRLYRLLHIARTSAYLQLDASRAAVVEAKRGTDVALYEKAVQLLRHAAPGDPLAHRDELWVERTWQEVSAETDRLEGELKGYRNNLIKESIRMGYDDLGRHYHAMGSLGEASKAFAKERDYCQTAAHRAIMIMRLINVFVDQESWLSVEANVQQLRNLAQSPAEAAVTSAKLSAALGLSQMALKNYGAAAQSFLECSPSILQARADEATAEDAYNEVLTPNDVATYGAICALASMDRNELHPLVLDNANFRSYLELEPHLRRAISSFAAGKYASCLSILESYRADYLLDLHLSKHFTNLIDLIRNKAIVQYFIPFSRVTLSALSDAFSVDQAAMIQSVIDLIDSDMLHARLDLANGVLIAETIDSRAKVHREALTAAKSYERTLQLRMHRMAVLNAGLEIRAPSKSQPTVAAQAADTLMGLDTTATKGKGQRTLRSFLS